MKEKIGYFLPVTLGMLTAFGPFLTDFYLPALPEMTVFFGCSASLVSASLMSGMIGLAIGQVLIGPLSDKYGRKRLLVGSMLLFALSSLGCIFSDNILMFNTFRLLQGLGGAGGVVLSKSISTDMFTGKELADFMAILAAINGIAPVVAPVAGGVMSRYTAWQGVFCILLAIGLVLIVCSLRLKESLREENRLKKNLWNVYLNLFKVFRNRRFTLSTTAMMFSFFAFFAYIAASPFIFQQVYGLSPFMFSLCFSLNALMVGVGAGLTTRFHHKNTALKWASIDMFISAVLVAVCQMLNAPLALLMPCYIYMLLCFGLMQPVATAIALDSEREHAGAASAIFGAAGFVAGAVVSPLVSLWDVMQCSSVLIILGALCCLLFTLPLCNTIKREGMNAAGK